MAVNINFDFRGSIYKRFPIGIGIAERLRSALRFSLGLHVGRHESVHIGIGHGFGCYFQLDFNVAFQLGIAFSVYFCIGLVLAVRLAVGFRFYFRLGFRKRLWFRFRIQYVCFGLRTRLCEPFRLRLSQFLGRRFGRSIILNFGICFRMALRRGVGFAVRLGEHLEIPERIGLRI